MIPLSPTDLEELLNELDLACIEMEQVGDYDLVPPINRILKCKSIIRTAMRVFESDLDQMYREYRKEMNGDEWEQD